MNRKSKADFAKTASSITEINLENIKSSNTDVFPLLAPFDISGSALRITVNNSIFREEQEKSKGAGNIRNISLLVGYKQGFVISILILLKIKNISYIFSLFS